jgi:hypothetical protein
MRFRKRVKVFPGFHLNFSSSGVSTSIGGKGASITFSKRGTYLNTSIPGLGLYDRQRLDGRNFQPKSRDFAPLEVEQNPTETVLAGEIKSADRESLTSTSLIEIKETLKEAYNYRRELRKEILKFEFEVKFAKTVISLSYFLVFGFFVPFIKKWCKEKEEYLTDLKNQLSNCKVDIDLFLENQFKERYDSLHKAFDALSKAQIIWDVTSQVSNDTIVTRSAANASITRKRVQFRLGNIDIIQSSHQAFHLENANGDDLYIYPAFVIVTKNKVELALISIGELNLAFTTMKFLEQERIASDTSVVGETWAKVNKNGQPDRRFKDNYRIPIVQYGQIDFASKSGLNESYCASNHESSRNFAEAFNDYKDCLN